MRELLVASLLAMTLVATTAAAEEPAEASALWMEQYGYDMVAAITFVPEEVTEGDLPMVTIVFKEGHNVSGVSGQYCRIFNPDPNIGATCYRAGLISNQIDNNSWTIDLAAQGDTPSPIPTPVAEERNGVQFFISRNGSEEAVNFPVGLPLDHPWFLGSEEDFVKWDEAQYFGFNTVAAESQPLDYGAVAWIVLPLLGALAVLVFVRKPKGLNVLLAVALALPAGFTLYDQSSSAATAPDFTLTDTGWENGEFRGEQEFSLSDFEGKTVVLDFMAYNCAACRHVTPNVMEPLWEEYGHRDDFSILTIDVGEFTNFPGSTQENLIRWQTGEEPGIPAADWLHALDTTGVFLDYVEIGAFGLPSIYIIDGERNVIFANSGSPNVEVMREVIDASLEGNAVSINVLNAGIIGFAALAGIASFFAPCSVGLIPAYMGFLIQRQNKHGAGTIPAGLATAAGIIILYAVIAVILWAFQDSLAGLDIAIIGPVVGAILVVLGILMLIGFDWDRIAKLFGMGKVDGRRGFFAFGVGYGLAAFGCTGPIFLPILVAGFAQSTAIGFLAFLVYAAAVSSLVLLAAYLVGAGQETRLKKLLSHTKAVTRISASLLILGGLFLLFYDLSAFAF